MARKATNSVTKRGVNIGKSSFHLIGLDGRCGSTTDSTDSPAIRPLIPQKQTKTMRKRKWRLECLLLGEKRTLHVRSCQDRS